MRHLNETAGQGTTNIGVTIYAKDLLNPDISFSRYPVAPGKPSRGEEARPFARAKVPKPNASEWSRRSVMSVFSRGSRISVNPNA
jgi:hypothetical protein